MLDAGGVDDDKIIALGGKVWSIGVSIPVPRACKARTLPIELMPQNAAMRLPGIEPGSSAWEAPMITITLRALLTPGGDRTRDPRLIRPVLYR